MTALAPPAPTHTFPDPEDGPLLFALDALFVDGRNPRATVMDDSIDELAANIAAFGLLTPLIGVRGPQGVGVIDGRRRLLALTRLAQQGLWAAPVAVLLCESDDAEGLAIAANTQRVALSPGQEARAFAAMLHAKRAPFGDDGPTRDDIVADIARAFGVGPRHVEQRLKLAALHPPILEALETGAIDLDTARVWTRADAALQAGVWEKLGPKAQKLAIVQALDKKAMSASGPIARFVGEARYVAAGGRVERDLFSDDGDALWLDRKIAETLCQQLLDEEKTRVEAEGWSRVETRRSPPGWKDETAKVKTRKPDAAERAVIEGLKAGIKAAEKARDAEVAALGEDADWRAVQTVEDRHEHAVIAPLEHKLAAAEEALRVYDAKLKASHGAIVYIDDDGRPGVRRAVIVKEKAVAKAGDAGAVRSSSKAAPSGPPPEPDLSWRGREAAAALAGHMIGRAFSAHPKAALAALAASLLREAFAPGFLPLDLSPSFLGKPAVPLPDDDGRAAQLAAWRDRVAPHLDTPEELVPALLDWDERALVDVIAFFSGNLVTPDRDGDDAADFAALGRFCGVDPAAQWTPDLAFCKEMSEPALRAALTEMGVAAHATASKPALAAMVADTAARVRWTHPLVRAITGATFTAIPVPETDPDAGAPARKRLAKAKRAGAITPATAPVIGGDAMAAGAYGDAPPPEKPKNTPTAKKPVVRKSTAAKAAP
ncbi:MAG: ParB N-terminal domain-containing protein [Hyphomonadaceae bacterium]|nr:ParB N-terminal domain-containing protein [Hyphomonadaceae bacterium]